MLLRRVAYARRALSTDARAAMLAPFTPPAAADPLRIVRGEGVTVWDEAGKRYIEGMAGLWCAGLGWGNEELIEAATAQLRECSYYHNFSGRVTPVAERLAERLIDLAPARLSGGRVFFGQSGSDANDTHVRLLWHYNIARGKPHKRAVISRQNGYHGVTLAAGSLTGLPTVHARMGLPLPFVAAHVTCPSHYRNGLPGESEAAFIRRLADELADAIDAAGGSDAVAAFIAEPVQGAGGVIVPPAGYFEAMRAVCDSRDVALISDEVICGLGRLGTFWGCQAFGCEPDLLTTAKQLTGGYVPLSASIINAEMCAEIEAAGAAGGPLGHGYTYSGHPVACAVALQARALCCRCCLPRRAQEVRPAWHTPRLFILGALPRQALEVTERDNLASRVRDEIGPHFQRRLRALDGHDLVGETRGMGLIGAIELVADKTSREHFTTPIAPAVVRAALDRGLIARALPGDAVALCPPMIISDAEIDQIFDRLEGALDDVRAAL